MWEPPARVYAINGNVPERFPFFGLLESVERFHPKVRETGYRSASSQDKSKAFAVFSLSDY